MTTPASVRFRRPRAIVFDLDGTLVDSALDLAATLNRQLSRHGRTQVALADVRNMIGEGAAKLVERGFNKTGGMPNGAWTLDKLTAEFLADYSKAVALHTRPFPHVVDALERFGRAGIAMGVCTSKAGALTRQLLDELDLTRHFAAVAGGDDVRARKPDPSHVLHVLERMGVPADNAIYVGDSETDVKTARNAKLPVILVTFGYTPTPAAQLGADAVIDCFSELSDLIQV
jgi:phosphoglycolate phosphatase